MNQLVDMHCGAYEEQTVPLSETEMARWHQQVIDWHMTEVDAIERLENHYSFADFAEALAFANRLGALATSEAHYPRLVVEWGQVSVQWWTEVVRGLHLNDFIMAARTTALYRQRDLQQDASATESYIAEERQETIQQTKQWWRDLTGKDLQDIQGDRERLIQLLQEKYGYSKAEAEEELGIRIDDYQRFVS